MICYGFHSNLRRLDQVSSFMIQILIPLIRLTVGISITLQKKGIQDFLLFPISR